MRVVPHGGQAVVGVVAVFGVGVVGRGGGAQGERKQGDDQRTTEDAPLGAMRSGKRRMRRRRGARRRGDAVHGVLPSEPKSGRFTRRQRVPDPGLQTRSRARRNPLDSRDAVQRTACFVPRLSPTGGVPIAALQPGLRNPLRPMKAPTSETVIQRVGYEGKRTALEEVAQRPRLPVLRHRPGTVRGAGVPSRSRRARGNGASRRSQGGVAGAAGDLAAAVHTAPGAWWSAVGMPSAP